MKRTIAIVGVVVAAGLALYAGNRLSAEPGAAGGAAPATMKMRLVNLQHVIKNYKRTESLRAEHTELFKQYDKQIKDIKDLVEARTKQVQDPKYADSKEAIEKEIKRLQREFQDKSEEARAAMEKKQADLIVLIYKDVDAAVKKYAQSTGIELVMHYNDAVQDSDRNSAQNVARKMSAGACMPMYMIKGLDISDEISGLLNAQYPGAAAAPAPAGGGVRN